MDEAERLKWSYLQSKLQARYDALHASIEAQAELIPSEYEQAVILHSAIDKALDILEFKLNGSAEKEV